MRMGGPIYCRACGSHHNCAKFCNKLPIQEVQIAFEQLQTAIVGIGLTRNERLEVNDLVKLMRASLTIPEEPIYNRANVTIEEIENTNAFPDLKWNPTNEQIKKATDLLDYLIVLMNERGKMTADKEKQFQSAITNLKEAIQL